MRTAAAVVAGTRERRCYGCRSVARAGAVVPARLAGLAVAVDCSAGSAAVEVEVEVEVTVAVAVAVADSVAAAVPAMAAH